LKRITAVGVVTLLGIALASPSTAGALDPAVEAKDFSKTQERSAIFNTPQYQLLLRQVSLQNRAASLAIQAADPERNFLAHLCASGEDGCAGEVRLYDWQAKGYGLVQPVLYTARNGATVSGRVWATRAGPAKRPVIVITNGSVQANEQMYWFVAQTLAKAGYVVLTTDPQGQGQSDEQGEAPDQNEGFPAQSDGRPFFDGTEDAINFVLSNRTHPYTPVPSCASGTSHAAKQNRRVAAGLNAPYNPFWALVDHTRLGIAGHSYGAAGVSYIAQWDPRVKAVVAWDNLGGTDPSAPFMGGGPVEQPCPANPAARTVAPITKPALGMAADYGLPATPHTSDPDPEAKTSRSVKYSQAGVDSGEIIIRGGSHLDFSWIPNAAFSGSLRGADEINWYTIAWFDKYVKGDPGADRRLMSSRWRSDAQEAAVDPDGDGNMFSFFYRSRLSIGLAGGGRFDCESMRPGCAGMSANDGFSGEYSYLTIDTAPDGPGTPAAESARAASTGIYGCGAASGFRVLLSRPRGTRIVRARVYLNGKRIRTYRGNSLKRVTVPAPGPGRHQLKIVERTSRGRTITLRLNYSGCKLVKPKPARR
jgi:dienelactone hydrolase